MRYLHHSECVGLIVSVVLTGSPCAWGFGTVTEIACAPTEPNVAAVLADGAVWVSSDHGKTWRFKGLPSNSVQSVDDEISQGEVDDDDLLDSSEAAALAASGAGEEESAAASADTLFDNEDPIQRGQVSNPNGYLAVDDVGNAAWAEGGVLAIVSAHGRAWRNLLNSAVRNVSFDRRGRLFAVFEDSILCFGPVDEGARFLFKLPLYLPRALIRGPAGEVRVFNSEGIYAIDEVGGAARLHRLLRVHAGVAAAFVPLNESESAETWLIADVRGVFEVAVGKRATRRITESAAVEKLLVDERGELRLYVSRVGWRKFEKGAFVMLSRYAVAVDAVGRFWESAPLGLSVPGVHGEKRADVNSIEVGTVLPFPALRGIRFPIPPQCRYFMIHPLPEINLSFSMTGAEDADLRESHAVNKAIGFSFGALFIWPIGKEDVAACRARHHRYQNERLRLIRKASDSAASLMKKEQCMNETRTLKDAVDARIARDKIRALLQFD